MSTILVLAGTGTVGSGVVQGLVSAGESVRVASRQPEKVTIVGAEAVRFDYRDASTFAAALDGVDRIFLLSPTGEIAPDKLLIPFLQEATRSGERKVVLMTASGVEFSDEIPLRKVELFVEKSGVPYVLLRPNWFMDNFHTYWLPSIQQAGVIAVPAAQAKSAFIDSRDIAASAVAALRTDRFDGQAFTLTGSESLTYGEAAAILSDASGRAIRYESADEPEFLKALTGVGIPEEYAQLLIVLFSSVRQGFAAQPTDAVRELTGREPYTLTQYATDHADLWK